MQNPARLIFGTLIIVGFVVGLRYICQDTMTKATTMTPADLGITEANGWKPVEFKMAPIDTTPMKPFGPTPQFPSKR